MLSPIAVVDDCARSFTFPALDNGYFYLAASRLSVHRDASDWAIVIETFGSNPRAGGPLLAVETFSSSLHDRNPPSNYVTPDAHANYLAQNPFNEARFFYPIERGAWIDEDDSEFLSGREEAALLRGRPIPVPSTEALRAAGIDLGADRPAVFEATRYWADRYRDLVLATMTERKTSVPPSMSEVLVLEDWRHPDLTGGQLPSETECFRMLDLVALTGDAGRYKPTEEPNTHWSNWPECGTL